MAQKILFLIRGLPGSGKSTMADIIKRAFKAPACHVEADMYFLGTDGVYRFDPKKLGKAHDWCRSVAFQAMADSKEIIIVSNTFCQRWEAEPYLSMAEEFGYKVQVLLCQGQFGSIHDVPDETLQRMKARFENDIL